MTSLKGVNLSISILVLQPRISSVKTKRPSAQDIHTDSLSFNIYNPEGKRWEEFQSKWKQTNGFFTHTTPKAKDEGDFNGSTYLKQAPKDVEFIEEIPIDEE
ncbi:hypothetical protein J1N35_043785, partial [Gossypium stocksii]